MWQKSTDLNQLPIGSKIVDPNTKYYGKPIVWIIADKNHRGYPDNTITLISEKVLCLKCFDAIEPNNSNDNRKMYGNSNYKYSNLLSWLNSSCYGWYRPQHDADAPPSSYNVYNGNQYDSEAGFLADFSTEFMKALAQTAFNTQTPSGDNKNSRVLTSKIFLASRTEVLLNDGRIREGESTIALFEGNKKRIAIPTQEAIENSNYKSNNLQAYFPWNWWLRSPNGDFLARIVNEKGLLGSLESNSGNGGVRPLCNIRNDANFFELVK